MKTKPERTLTDLEFIENPMEWPNWPVLTLIRRVEHEVGLILAHEPTVYVGANAFGMHERPGHTWGEKLEGFKQEKFATFEELLKVWRID